MVLPGALWSQARCVTFAQPLDAMDGDRKKPADCTGGCAWQSAGPNITRTALRALAGVRRIVYAEPTYHRKPAPSNRVAMTCLPGNSRVVEVRSRGRPDNERPGGAPGDAGRSRSAKPSACRTKSMEKVNGSTQVVQLQVPRREFVGVWLDKHVSTLGAAAQAKYGSLVTPAMEAEITDHVWDLSELIA